ncbi:MAG: hypothetical protein JWO67_6937 [Streptosporangiaceae bacterium]|nr:hypothetical protein [Streptosporangiaceae bacterium]
MPRSYSLTTIKTLFGEASTCAHPECDEPLIFTERGRTTAVAEIAHIRSETPGGPRHDPAYVDEINGSDNLLLLCGKHHRAVDRHESLYSVAELEGWKAQQRESGGTGVTAQLSDSDLRAYQGLSNEEREALAKVARLAQRVIATCEAGYQAAEQVRRDAEQAQLASAANFGPIYMVDEAGNQTPINPRDISLPVVEQRKWEAQEREVAESHRLQALVAKQALDEELAVLRMFAPDLTRRCDYVSRTSATVPKYIGQYEPVLSQTITDLRTAIAQLWRAANGETDDQRS